VASSAAAFEVPDAGKINVQRVPKK